MDETVKTKRFTAQLPAVMVTEQMRAEFNAYLERTGKHGSEVIRHALSLFLRQNSMQLDQNGNGRKISESSND